MSTTFSTGVPNLFTSPMNAFGPRSLFHSSERPAENTQGGASFTQEDRLMLHLLYQQQQAIQFQLQSMALSIQQLNMTMTGISAPSVSMPVYGNTMSDASPAANATTSAPVQTNTSVNHTSDAAGSASFIARSEQRNFDETASASAAAATATTSREHPIENASHLKEVSRSCTPPHEGSDVSRQSVMNHSMDSAAPWDPAAGSRHSSVIHASRGENPLLSSLRGKLPTPNRSAVGSVSAGTGYNASANVSASLEDSKPSIRPTVHPSASSSFHTEQESHNMSNSRNATSSQTHRHQRIVLDNRKVEQPQRSHSNLETSTASKNEKKTEHTKDWNTASSHQGRIGNEEYGETNTSALGYESQSDGYGSYETREYLKRVGII